MFLRFYQKNQHCQQIETYNIIEASEVKQRDMEE